MQNKLALKGNNVINEVELFMNLEKQTKQLKKKKLGISQEKLDQYDQILCDIDPPNVCKVSSHRHELKRHPLVHHSGWNCDHLKGLDRCLSGVTDFY
jgi:hypothetical protein